MRDRPVADLAALPLHGKLSASVTWWGTLSFMLIEGTGFGLVLAIYFYLASLATEWPIGAPPPDLGPGTIVTLILLASVVPNWFVMHWAERESVGLVRIGSVVMVLFGAAPLVFRWYDSPPCMSDGTATLTARSPGPCWGCTRRTLLPT